MATPSELALLAQTLGNNESYLSENPFFMGGRALTQMQLPRATTNAEAWIGPALQGLLSGVLTGYGRSEAKQDAWNDFRSQGLIKALQNPYSDFTGPLSPEQSQESQLWEALHPSSMNPLFDYSSEDVPDGWSPDKGKSDILRSMLQEQPWQEYLADKAVKKQELANKIAEKELEQALKYSDTAIIGEGLLEQAKASGKKTGEGASGAALKDIFGVEKVGKIAQTGAFVDAAFDLGSQLESGDKSWTNLRLARNFSGLDKDGLAIEIQNLADRLTRARTGAALNKNEQKLYESLIGGDLSASPQQVGKLLKKLATAERDLTIKELKIGETASVGGIPAVIEDFSRLASEASTAPPPGATPTGRTYQGKPVYSVNGKLWVP